jgi:hypothetical protein
MPLRTLISLSSVASLIVSASLVFANPALLPKHPGYPGEPKPEATVGGCPEGTPCPEIRSQPAGGTSQGTVMSGTDMSGADRSAPQNSDAYGTKGSTATGGSLSGGRDTHLGPHDSSK